MRLPRTIGGLYPGDGLAICLKLSASSKPVKSGYLLYSPKKRIPGFEDIPTAKEQGFDVVAVNWRGLYVPKGVSDEVFNSWAEKLQKVADSAEWKEAMAANGLAPFTKVGGDFQGYVDQVVGEIRQLSKDIGVIK